MIYIIGVNHKLQHNGPNSASIEVIDDFKKYIKTIIDQNNISILAEEFNEEGITENRATESTCRELSKVISVEHKFCDPEKKTRKELGISDIENLKDELRVEFDIPTDIVFTSFKNNNHDNAIGKEIIKRLNEFYEYEEEHKKEFFAIREKYWLDYILDNIDENIIFICGYSHVKRFHNLLRESNIEAIILDYNWGDLNDD